MAADIETLLPMVDDIGVAVIHHGERAELDPAHPDACLCGRYANYLECPEAGEFGEMLIGLVATDMACTYSGGAPCVDPTCLGMGECLAALADYEGGVTWCGGVGIT